MDASPPSVRARATVADACAPWASRDPLATSHVAPWVVWCARTEVFVAVDARASVIRATRVPTASSAPA